MVQFSEKVFKAPLISKVNVNALRHDKIGDNGNFAYLYAEFQCCRFIIIGGVRMGRGGAMGNVSLFPPFVSRGYK